MGNILNQISIICLLVSLACFAIKGHATNAESSLSEQTFQKDISILPLPERKPVSRSLTGNQVQTAPIKKEALFKKLNDIVNKIKLQKKALDEKLSLLKKAKTEQEKRGIQAEIDEISQSITEQEQSFEMILAGGQELSNLKSKPESSFDWQEELIEILKPILNELHEMTEEKRKLVNLQNKIPLLESQIKDINRRLEGMTQINKSGLEREALERFEQINKKWKNLLEEKKHLREVAQLQLNEILRSEIENEVSISDDIKHFITGRGATLFFALMAFMAVYFSLKLLWKAILMVSKRKPEEGSTYFQRIFMVIYHAATFIFCLAAVFYVLYVRNDQVLIAIAVLLLIILVLVLRNSIPRYIDELNILLNAGSVREGESISYNGIPMKVANLGLYTKLTNPLLPKLELRLPLSELPDYLSRPIRNDDPWFPCQEGDFVMLSDGTYNMVQCITLENVILSIPNGMMPQTYTIGDFLAAKPKNFSHGFVVVSDFGLDYKYQEHSTTQIPDLLCTGVREGLKKEVYGKYLKDIWVFFAKANTSSLDYKIVTIFDGQAAADYYAITRDLQRYAVEVCNRQQWEIPFTQLVVHSN